MNTCGTCKYFGKLVQGTLDNYWDEPETVNAKFHVCDLLKHLNKEHPVDYSELAGVIDGSGYRATFCVSEEFGCNQWAPRAELEDHQ